MADHDALRAPRSSPRCIAETRCRRPARGASGAVGGARSRRRRPPAIRGSRPREAAAQIAALAGDQRARGQRETRRAIGDDARRWRRGRFAARQHHRHRDHPGQHAAEKPDHEADAVRAQQQGAVARRGARRDPPGQGRRRAGQFGEGDPRHLPARGPTARYRPRSSGCTAARWRSRSASEAKSPAASAAGRRHRRVCRRPALRGRRYGGPARRRRIVEHQLGLQLDADPFLELDDEIGRGRRIEPHLGKADIGSDRDRRIVDGPARGRRGTSRGSRFRSASVPAGLHGIVIASATL